jgi:hypothetical protein
MKSSQRAAHAGAIYAGVINSTNQIACADLAVMLIDCAAL